MAEPRFRKIVRKESPQGEAGVRFSLEEVARRATEGAESPVVHAWVTHRLKEAGNPQNSLDRAKAILAAIRRDFIYVPDPMGVEMMADAHLLADGTFAGGDCDDLTIFLLSCTLAALSSAGVRCGVVGHGYGREGYLGHVLAAVYYKGAWYYMDPSVGDDKAPFGNFSDQPTRERVIAVPVEKDNIEVLCDAASCLRAPKPAEYPKHLELYSRQFVGLSGAPSQLDGAPGEEESEDEAWRSYLSNLEERLRVDIDMVNATRKAVYDLAAEAGVPMPVSPIGKKVAWHIDTEQDAMIDEVLAQVALGVEALHDAVIGRRKIISMTDEPGFGLGLLPTDTVRLVMQSGDMGKLEQNLWQSLPMQVAVSREEASALSPMNQAPGRPHGTSERPEDSPGVPGSVGAAPAAPAVVLTPLIWAGAAGLVIIAIAVLLHLDVVCMTIMKVLEDIIAGLTKDRVLTCHEKMVAAGRDPAECAKAAASIDAGQAARTKALGDAVKGAQEGTAKGISVVAMLVLAVAGAGALGYGIYWYEMKRKKAAA